jgi:predicted transcriptional regulator
MRNKSIREHLNEEKEDKETSDDKDSTYKLLECVLGLNDLDIKCYRKIRDVEPTWTDELSEDLGKDESTIHRSVSRLADAGVIKEEKIPYKNGGYKHEYTIEDTEKVSRIMRTRISEMLSSTFRGIDNFEENLQEES